MEQVKDLLFSAVVIVAAAACLYLYIKAVIDIHQTKFASHREKALWLNIVILTPVIGSIFYFSNKRQVKSPRLPV